jgi:glycosyltransferase involved in cell wall biosynthesis
MAQRLAQLGRDRELRHAMGARGRAKVVREFQLDRQINVFLEAYRSLAAGSAEP